MLYLFPCRKLWDVAGLLAQKVEVFNFMPSLFFGKDLASILEFSP